MIRKTFFSAAVTGSSLLLPQATLVSGLRTSHKFHQHGGAMFDNDSLGELMQLTQEFTEPLDTFGKESEKDKRRQRA